MGDRFFLRALGYALCAAISLATLGGCSALRIGYNNLDTFAAWTAEEYFDLDAAQKQEFSRRFDRLHEWHRYEQLPDYAAQLSALGDRLQQGLAPDDVLSFVEGIVERYRRLLGRGADDAAALLAGIRPGQIEALRRQWDRDNRRFVREYRLGESAEVQRREAAQRAISRVRDWAGSLTAEQELKIAERAGELPMNHRLRHEDRLRRQREFLRLLEQRADPGFPAQLRHWLLHWEEGRDPEYQRLWELWPRRQAEYYVAVAHMLTPEQRARALDRLRRYADDFTQLARKPAPSSPAAR